jgi:hypothetical protein
LSRLLPADLLALRVALVRRGLKVTLARLAQQAHRGLKGLLARRATPERLARKGCRGHKA